MTRHNRLAVPQAHGDNPLIDVTAGFSKKGSRDGS
jgi:hypothetical protein